MAFRADDTGRQMVHLHIVSDVDVARRPVTRGGQDAQCRMQRGDGPFQRLVRRSIRNRIGCLDGRDFHQRGRDHRVRQPFERDLVERRGCGDGGTNHVARERFAPIEDVCADGATGDGTRLNLLEIVGLADIDDERDDVNVVLVHQPSDGGA